MHLIYQNRTEAYELAVDAYEIIKQCRLIIRDLKISTNKNNNYSVEKPNFSNLSFYPPRNSLNELPRVRESFETPRLTETSTRFEINQEKNQSYIHQKEVYNGVRIFWMIWDLQ